MPRDTKKKAGKKLTKKKKKSTREKKKNARDAAVKQIKKARKKQGRKKKKISRREIEAAIISDTGLSQTEVNDALAESYDDLAALGLVRPRA